MMGRMESFSPWGVRSREHDQSRVGWAQAALAILFLSATIALEWARQMGR
jgi:hypothetical protein